MQKAGIALDIGTTTVSAQLVDLDTGSVIDTFTQLNEQRLYGADVITRINAAKKGKTAKLYSLINRQTQKILEYFLHKWNIQAIEKLSVSANTVMLHLFLNIDPSGMGQFPFTPVFLEEKKLKGDTFLLSVKDISILPSISSFIGADITAGLAVLDAKNRKSPFLLVDIGTNGEIALVNGEKILCTSAAAGPAFEAGICGSAFIDTVSALLKQGIIDETGFMENAGKITAKDIRQFQLAKSAIYSGITILCKRAGLQINDIQDVFVAGEFGFNINRENAITVGLFPKEFPEKITVCQNLSLEGAVENLTCKHFIDKCKNITKCCTVIDLASDPAFSDEFANNMLFNSGRQQ
jgi:uncharacterized 2Fe-2S/4Fe-4S cluster protein (DUF4445 family)